MLNNKLLTFATVSLACSTVAMGGVFAWEKLSNQSKLSINSLGGVTVGMTISQASKAAGIRLITQPFDPSCYYIKPQGQPKDVSFMMTGEGRIARIDIDNKSITTIRGAKIGDTEARIKSLYPGQIKVKQHEYLKDGHYLVFVPSDRADQNYRVVFETDGKRVIRMRSGKLPEVEYVEGCA
ncbi:MAG TPA: hypothetical protein VK203_08800 [Nostocaceae cyanobacterium]|nr:hypothetical protein [Nostocaceae cyanobacterium]